MSFDPKRIIRPRSPEEIILRRRLLSSRDRGTTKLRCPVCGVAEVSINIPCDKCRDALNDHVT